jgi:hypothetical protein
MSDKPFLGFVPIPKYVVTQPKDGPAVTDAEWSAKHRTPLFKAGSEVNGANYDYTVPTGYRWYITQIFMEAEGWTGTAAFPTMAIVELKRNDATSGNTSNLLRLKVGMQTNKYQDSQHICATYPCPLVLEPGTRIRLEVGTEAFGQFSMTGWEEKAQ